MHLLVCVGLLYVIIYINELNIPSNCLFQNILLSEHINIFVDINSQLLILYFVSFEEATSKIQDNILNKISHVTDTLGGYRCETRPERRMWNDSKSPRRPANEILEQAIKPRQKTTTVLANGTICAGKTGQWLSEHSWLVSNILHPNKIVLTTEQGVLIFRTTEHRPTLSKMLK